MSVMISYFPYLFIYTFQLLAQFSYPVTLPHPCDLTVYSCLEASCMTMTVDISQRENMCTFFLTEA